MKTIKLTTTYEKQTGKFAQPGHFKVDQTLTLMHRGLPFRSGAGGWDENGEGRLVEHGPMVKGPELFGYGKCTVIDNYGGTGQERKDKLATGMEIDVEAGDLVEVEGVGTWKVAPLIRGGYIWLKFEKA